MDNNAPISAKFNYASRTANLFAEDDGQVKTLCSTEPDLIQRITRVAPEPVFIHANYDEHNSYAQKCITLRVPKGGILLREPSINGVVQIKHGVTQSNAWAIIVERVRNLVLDVGLGRQGQIGSGPTNGTVTILKPRRNTQDMLIPVTANDPGVS